MAVNVAETQLQPVDEGQVEALVRRYFSGHQFPERCYSYVAEMVIDEAPGSPEELLAVLKDYFADGFCMSESETQRTAGLFYGELQRLGLKHVEKMDRIVAEKMEESVVIGQVGISTETYIGEYIDPFLGIKRANVNFNSTEKQWLKPKKAAAEEAKAKLEEFKTYRKVFPMPLLTHARGESRSCDIMIDRFTLTVGGKNLLDNASLKITYGRKYGLVGRNGIGKTCLLVAMALREIEKIPGHIRILYVEQEVIGEEKTALESLLETDQERTELLKQAHEFADDSEKLEVVYRRLDEIGANAAPGKAAAILSGLGFTNETMNFPTKTLSGGWLMRVALARALFADPEILLLDEPTNHLDMEATIWLENYLKSYNHTLIIVSHARDFINNVITDVIHYVSEKLNYYRGNYETFERTRADVYTMQKRQFESQQSHVAHMKKFIDRFRCNAKRASLVQSRIKALNRMEIIDEVVEDPTCVFIFPPVEKISPPLLRIEEGSFSYGEKKIFSQVTMNIDMSTRIVLLGQNGSGKSTLLKVLTGELLLTEGNFFSNRRMRIGLFTQQHVDQLDLSLSPLEQMAKLFPGEISETLRGHLGSFGITGNMALRPMYLLSGGQKSRVALSLIAFRQPHVLLLDEPTNHLDLDAVNALIVALNAYSGGVVVVSHDQHFVTSICDELFVIKKGKLKQFKGTFEDYKQSLL